MILIWLIVKATVDLFRHGSGLVLNEVKSVHHAFDCLFSILANRKHTDDTARKTVVKTESGPSAAFHVKRDGFETTHVEESLVLDLR